MTQPDRNDHVGDALSGYMDGELTQQQRQRVEQHIGACAQCRTLHRELMELRGRLNQSIAQQFGDDRFREAFTSPTNRALGAAGWIALVAGMLLLGVIVFGAFIADDSVSPGMKLLIGLPYLGVGLLFIAVLRRRLREARTDKYNDVEI